MRSTLIMVMILLLASPVVAQSMEREMSLSFDGEIDYLSESGSDAGQSVLQVEGEGKGGFVQESTGTTDTFSYHTQGETDGVDVISGVQLYTGDIYLTNMDGQAEWQDSYSAEIDLFPTIAIATESTVAGRMARIINMKNNGLWINERFSVTGAVWVLDQLRFSPDEDDDE